MQLKYKKPCHECPWRKDAPAGWLGGHSAETYADAVDNNEVPACHLNDYGPKAPRTAMCAGALGTMSNQCKSAYNTDGGDAARQVVGQNPECFSHVAEFYTHHTDQAYVPPILRRPLPGVPKDDKQ